MLIRCMNIKQVKKKQFENRKIYFWEMLPNLYLWFFTEYIFPVISIILSEYIILRNSQNRENLFSYRRYHTQNQIDNKILKRSILKVERYTYQKCNRIYICDFLRNIFVMLFHTNLFRISHSFYVSMEKIYCTDLLYL